MNLLENWSEEKSSAYLYAIVAQYEENPSRKQLFLELKSFAEKQAGIWEDTIKKSGAKIPEDFKPNLRTRLIGKLIPFIGTKNLRFILSAMKVRGMSIYSNGDASYPFTLPAAHHEHHKGVTNAGNLRAAIFGINDGLVSNMSLLLGIAGATMDHHFIILAGVAGLLAGASSMAAGEYVSVRSQLEFYKYQIDIERSELEQYPEEEASELAAIYHARGLSKEEAYQLAKQVISNPDKALDTLAREELGLNPNDLGSPFGAAISSFLAFCTGAAIPVIPFLFGKYQYSLAIAIALTAVTLFAIGAILSLFTNQSALKSGLRMLAIGTAAGVVTFVIGKWIGVGINL